MAVVCTTCNAENPAGAVFCEECGIELPAEAPVSADVREPLVEEAAAESRDDPSTGPAEDEPAAVEPEPAHLAPARPEDGMRSSADEATVSVNQTTADESLASVSREVESASLTLMEYGNPTDTVIPLKISPVAVGKFDPAQGPIDIDLGHLTGNEYISRRHAELNFDDGWTIRDLGSTNGVFIRRHGQSDFLPRLQAVFRLENGDEIAFGNMRFIFRQSGD